MTHRVKRIDDTWYHRPDGVRDRVSAGGIVVRAAGERIYIALTKEPDIPLFVLPKGGVKDGEDLETAARREIEEEAGLREISLVSELGASERLNYTKDRWQTTHYFLFRTEQIEGRPTDSSHDGGPWWYPIDELPPMLWPEQWELIESSRERIEQLFRG